MSDLDRAAALDALDAAYQSLTAVAGRLGAADLMRPTRCAGWAVADVRPAGRRARAARLITAARPAGDRV